MYKLNRWVDTGLIGVKVSRHGRSYYPSSQALARVTVNVNVKFVFNMYRRLQFRI